MNITSWIAIGISFGALLYSFLTYRRNRKFENANHIYKLKVEIYSKILVELNTLIDDLQTQVYEANDYLKNPDDQEKIKLFNELADKADTSSISFDNFIINNSLVIPEKILGPLENFCHKILNTEPINTKKENLTEFIKEAEDMVDSLIKDADEINKLLRKDIHVEELNLNLYKRLKSRL